MSLQSHLKPWAYETSGGFTVRGLRSQPSGRPLIHFVHGNGYSGLVYEQMLAQLLPYADLFISDVQGHGDSDHGGAFRGWNSTAHLCEAALHQFADDYQDRSGQRVPILGVGHSFGGVMTTLMMANSPSLFQRSVLLDPVIFSPAMARMMAISDAFGRWKNNAMARRARKRRTQWSSREEAFDYFHQRGIFRGWDDLCLTSYVAHGLTPVTGGGVTLKCHPEREAELFGSFPRKLWRSIERIETPTHLIYGERTYPFVGKSALRWQAINPGVTTETAPGGHCFMLEQPRDTAGRILRHLP
ncbi:alpha/beta fold hydrolase [Marinobacter caseinilyticus]|uniref:alpha/beta fold hydrolase n=1 Tax=Marinobacter caseinilyticus TaxID=2692195 RepID=UPI001F33DE78|nr:alpha/beta hydrolase [Marinobacter caseinilyticus]